MVSKTNHSFIGLVGIMYGGKIGETGCSGLKMVQIGKCSFFEALKNGALFSLFSLQYFACFLEVCYVDSKSHIFPTGNRVSFCLTILSTDCNNLSHRASFQQDKFKKFANKINIFCKNVVATISFQDKFN